MHLLCVEDDPDSALLVEVIAAIEGWTYTWAATGASGLAEAQKAWPEIVLLDLDLPDMHGFELAATLCARAGGRPLVLIGWTADSITDNEAQAQQVGLAALLIKPVDVDRLVQTIRAQVG